MKQYHILILGIWALLAAGAYVAGTAQPPTESAGSRREPMPGRSNAGKLVSDSNSPTGETVPGVAGWLQKYQDGVGAISPERMKEAMRAALRDPDPLLGTRHFAHLLVKKLTPENAPAVLRAIHENASASDSVRLFGLLAHEWGSLDGAAALAGLQSLKRPDLRSETSKALAAWASRDPEAAKLWMAKREEKSSPRLHPLEGIALRRGLIGGMARRDLEGTLDYVMTFQEDQRTDFARVLADQKLMEGVAIGAEWALTLPEEGMRTSALETVGDQYIREDLTGATKWAEEIAGRPDAHEAVADVANELAKRNGQDAAAWALKLPPGPSQNDALEAIFDTWTRADALAASQSLNGMEQGAVRDSAIKAFSRTLARENPADALTWAGALSDEKERIDVQVEIARDWRALYPKDAQAWITANLPVEEQARAMDR